MRTQASDAERQLWKHLRAHRFKGYKFRRQVVIEPYIVDFVCFEAMLIIEADGGQHMEQQGYDSQRTKKLESMGYTVIRFWNHEILGGIDAVLEVILKVLMDLSPLPGLSLGERGKNRVAARLANEWYPSA
jgi:very-short-patch-repair endonuclease